MNKLELVIIICIIFFVSNCTSGENENTINNLQSDVIEDTTTVKEEVNDTIVIIGVGDMMLGTDYPSSFLPPKDMNLLIHVKDILKSADVTFGNLEGVLLDKGKGGTPKNCSNPKTCYTFRMPERNIDYLLGAGFDVISIANNHMGDFGSFGRENTVKTLEKAGINYAGLVKYPYTTFEINGVKYGFCAFAPNRGTMDIRNIAAAQKIVRKLDSISDIVIVSFHGGGEGSKFRHVNRKTEYCFGENRGNVYQFSHKMIDAGADVIFGHGPHITRGVELYKNKFIAYSMGNFCTYKRISISGIKGISPIIELKINKSGEFLSGKIHSVIQNHNIGTSIDPNKKALKEIKTLTSTDFPESKLIIADDGTLTVGK